jgi:hypothetical protein
MDGYTWIVSEKRIDIFHHGDVWGSVIDTADGFSQSSLDNLIGLLPNHIVEAVKADFFEQQAPTKTQSSVLMEEGTDDMVATDRSSASE